jgi:hypothetical protein
LKCELFALFASDLSHSQVSVQIRSLHFFLTSFFILDHLLLLQVI